MRICGQLKMQFDVRVPLTFIMEMNKDVFYRGFILLHSLLRLYCMFK